MFPMIGCYGMNPFGGWGCYPHYPHHSTGAEIGFLLGLAAATITAVRPSNAKPTSGSLFTNPFIYNQTPYQSNVQTQNINTNVTPSVGNFGSLTASTYSNTTGFTGLGNYDINMPYYMPTLTTPDVAISASIIANNIVNNINAQAQAVAQAQAQAQVQVQAQTPAQTTQNQSASSSSYTTSSASQTTINEPQGGDLKPGLFKGRLAGQEALVTRICRKYGVSPALVASIIGLESGWGTSNLAMHNNFGGYRAAGDLGKNEKGFGYFSTIEKGLDAMIKNLADYTRYRDVAQVNFNNLDSIGRHYCEGGVWSGQVRQMYSSRVSSYIA